MSSIIIKPECMNCLNCLTQNNKQFTKCKKSKQCSNTYTVIYIITNVKLKLLMDVNVVKWLRYDLSFLDQQTQQEENKWGRKLCNNNKNWTTCFSEQVVKEVFAALLIKLKRPLTIQGHRPDFESNDSIIEVKCGTYLTPGTAHEKILGTPFKYNQVPKLYGKKLQIVLVGKALIYMKKFHIFDANKMTPYTKML